MILKFINCFLQHGFCEKCCDSWYGGKQKNECPMCRKTLEKGFDQQVFMVMSSFEATQIDKELHGAIINLINSKTTKIKL